jgi:hypothetical protein
MAPQQTAYLSGFQQDAIPVEPSLSNDAKMNDDREILEI